MQMDIEIAHEASDERGIYLSLTSGKTSGFVSYSALCGDISVCCQNRAHQAWRRGGRRFRTFAEAMDAYRSVEMRAFIAYLRDRTAERFPERFSSAEAAR